MGNKNTEVAEQVFEQIFDPLFEELLIESYRIVFVHKRYNILCLFMGKQAFSTKGHLTHKAQWRITKVDKSQWDFHGYKKVKLSKQERDNIISRCEATIKQRRMV